MKYSILFFLLILPYSAIAQQQADSLLRVYRNQPEDTSKLKTISALFNAYLYNDRERARHYAFEALRLARSLNDNKWLGLSFYQLANYYNNYDRLDSARFYYQQAHGQYSALDNLAGITSVYHGLAILDYSEGKYDSALLRLDQNIELYLNRSISDSIGLALSYDFKGMIHAFIGNYQIALTETLRGLKILEKLDEPIRKADALNHMAAIEFYLENFEKSIEYNLQALEVYTSFEDEYYQAQVHNDLGNTYYYLEQYQEALEALKQSVSLSRKMGVPVLEATALNNLGKTYLAIERYEEAMSNFSAALRMTEELNNPNKLVETLLDMGNAYQQLDQPEQALTYLDRGILIADSIGVKSNLRNGYQTRALAYEKLRNYRAALEDYRQYASLNDSILNEKKSRQIEELRAIYESEKKEQQIALQDQEIGLLKQEAKIRILQLALLAGGLALSLLLVYAIRQKLRRQKVEKEKVDQELEFKQKELTTQALQLARKNEMLESLKLTAKAMKNENSSNVYQKLIKTIDLDLKDDQNWENFSRYFEQVHKDFNSRIKSKYPDVTANELRLLALMKMNLTAKEIANILNISQEGIKKARYRLRKKLDVTREDSLQDLALKL